MATPKINISKISDFPKVMTPEGSDRILIDREGKGGSITLSQIPVSNPVEDRIKGLSGRIDNLAKVPEGGTSGDQELIDIRNPADGFSVPEGANAGGAVRAQVTQLDEKISNLKTDLFNFTANFGAILPFEWKKFIKPSEFPYSIPFNIYSDGHNFITDFNVDEFKNSGGTTYYVTKRLETSSLNDGLTREKPIQFASAYSRAVDGDTIILLENDYDRDSLDWGTTIIQKNINIIGEGNCRIFAGQLNMSFTKTDGYSYVYQTDRSVAKRVIDYKSIEGKYISYVKVTSIAEVDETLGSYYIDGSTVYVHALNNGNPSEVVCVTVQSENFLNVNNENHNTTVVFQNIELIGKETGVLFNKSNTSNALTVICDNVRTYYCGNKNNDSFKVYGGTAIFNKCKSICSYKDGFNYNGINVSNVTTDTFCIEIDCIGANCGLLQSSENQNGTTGHAGVKILRINGKYYNNFGANVADVQTDTMSINLGCKAFYSSGTESGANENFSAQQAGATMWLYGCVGVGATKDLSCVSGSIMNLDKCTYKVKAGAGTYNEVDTIPFDLYTMYKISEIY